MTDQRLATLVRQLQGALGGIRSGTVTFTFTASSASATVTVAHGLGKVPGSVFVADWWIPGIAAGFSPVRLDTLDDTSFQCRGETGPGYGAISASIMAGWIAIG